MRVESDCGTYRRCGGCNLRHIRYEDTLKIKQNIVQNLINKELETKLEVKETIGMKEPYYYRNKVQFPVGYNKDNKIVKGVYANRTHEIIETQGCLIQNKQSEMIANFIIEFMIKHNIPAYNEKNRKGIIRHIVVKSRYKTNQVMCIIVVNQMKIPKEHELVKGLLENFSEYRNYCKKNVNTKNTECNIRKY